MNRLLKLSALVVLFASSANAQVPVVVPQGFGPPAPAQVVPVQQVAPVQVVLPANGIYVGSPSAGLIPGDGNFVKWQPTAAYVDMKWADIETFSTVSYPPKISVYDGPQLMPVRLTVGGFEQNATAPNCWITPSPLGPTKVRVWFTAPPADWNPALPWTPGFGPAVAANPLYGYNGLLTGGQWLVPRNGAGNFMYGANYPYFVFPSAELWTTKKDAPEVKAQNDKLEEAKKAGEKPADATPPAPAVPAATPTGTVPGPSPAVPVTPLPGTGN